MKDFIIDLWFNIPKWLRFIILALTVWAWLPILIVYEAWQTYD